MASSTCSSNEERKVEQHCVANAPSCLSSSESDDVHSSEDNVIDSGLGIPSMPLKEQVDPTQSLPSHRLNFLSL
jgi:hypothetical protein